MPFSVPLPLGGFGTELGSLTERQRALETARVTGSSATWTASVDVPGSSSTWGTPTNWPSITVPACYTGGVFLVAGATITDLSGTSEILIGVSVDGTSPDLTGAIAFGLGSSYDVYPVTIISVIAPVALADHTYQLQAFNTNTTDTHLINAFLTVDPF